MDILSAFILGVVEGITEFLPISSTGHLVMTGRLIGLSQTEFVKSFEIAIQLGAVCAVLWESRRLLLDRNVLARVVVAFIPTAVIGLIAYDTVKTLLLGNELVTVIALGVGGLALIAFEHWHLRARTVKGSTMVDDVPIGKITYAQATAIGFGQSFAMIPGVSRSAASIVTALGIGIPRITAVEFSFLLAVPTIAAATALDVLKGGFAPSADQLVPLAVGFITAGIVAWFSIKFLLQYVRTNTFIPFGVYRIIAALLYWWLIL